MRFNDQKKLYRQNALTQSDILNLPDSRGLDVTVVSGKCADIIRSIHESMSRMAPMGDDDRRSLWFEVKGKRWEWYRMSVSTYKDRHYLYITGITIFLVTKYMMVISVSGDIEIMAILIG